MVTPWAWVSLFLPHWLLRRRFRPADLDAIEAAVGEAEQGHRGEVRVVIELAPSVRAVLAGDDVASRAAQAFAMHRVWDTEDNTGVLIFLAWAEREVRILADRGLAEKVSAAEWARWCEAISAGCRAGRPAPALVTTIRQIGERLRRMCDAPPTQNPDELGNRPILS